MKVNNVITNIDELTPEWLTDTFKNNGHLTQGKVTKIIKRKSRETSTSFMHYFRLRFSNDSQVERPIRKIVVRLPKNGPLSKDLGIHEAKFYSTVAESMNQMPIPTCYDATISHDLGLSHIILEDLSKRYIEAGSILPPSKRYFEKAIDCLAELHVFWWDHPKLKELSKLSYTFLNFKENSFNDKDHVILSLAPNYEDENLLIERFLKFFENKISIRRKQFFKNVFSLLPQVVFERIKKKNSTIVHTDAHVGNFFYPKDLISNQKSKAILFDWQTWGIGIGCQDLAFMIGLFYYPDYRSLIEKDLIKRYHINLLKSGIKDYSWDDCWYDYKLSTLLNIYRIIFWWSLNVPLEYCISRLESSIYTIQDLNCMELLEG